jgi:hypothetical protein
MVDGFKSCKLLTPIYFKIEGEIIFLERGGQPF